jgi:hypothetical protein
MLNCTDSKLRNPSTLGLLLLTPIKSNNDEELCEAAFGIFVNWMVGGVIGEGVGGTQKRKGLDYYD